MLVYAKRASPKEPKRRSRAGCIHCKEKKKKCNEERPRCDRCIERNLKCGYEPVKPRKRRRSSFAASVFSGGSDSPPGDEPVLGIHEVNGEHNADGYGWETEVKYLPVSEEGWHLDDVEEIVRKEPPPSGTMARSRSHYPDLAMIAPCPIPSPLDEFGSPLFMEFSEQRNRRALVDHFCNVLSHLIVFKEDTGNPFRQLVLPLSHASSPVMNAIFALSSAHLEYRGIENPEKSLYFHNMALQGLAQLLDKNDQSSKEEIMGAIMLLVYYEVLVQRNNSSIVTGHLKGALAIINSGPRVSTPAGLFLERAFRFYDTIAALSLGTAPNITSQPTSFPFPESSSYHSIPNSPLSSVDTLLGLVTDLWPIIHQLSHLLPIKENLDSAILAGDTKQVIMLQTELEDSSQAIELALSAWEPPVFVGKLDDTPSDIQQIRMEGILNNAEAYRQSAFIYLYRTIHTMPRSSPSVQSHTHLSLLACSNVVTLAEKCHDGPMSALLWPLFVASCEAMSDDDRALALIAFGGTERRQGMNNIARAWEVVQEVWRRVDEADEADVNWRDVCEERGFSIIFG